MEVEKTWAVAGISREIVAYIHLNWWVMRNKDIFKFSSIKNLPKWILICSFSIDSLFLFANYAYYVLVPPPSQFEILPFIGVILVFNTFGGLFLALFIVI